MNDVLKAIFERNSCRDFSGEPLTDEQVDLLVKSALAAPSAMNAMPWHVIAVTDKEMLDEMDAYMIKHIEDTNPDWHNRMKERGGKIFYNAPCLILIAKNDSEWAALDAGIVSQNVALAAHSLGLGNVICGMARLALEGVWGEEWAKRLRIPEGYTFGMSVCVGIANKGKTPHELNYEKMTYIK
ncbi:MAG: nitroreductase family protein [Defluviitaleaceae bacterium]|nr:nitroreductase family protein [Defluviitaleaceae bacterium]